LARKRKLCSAPEKRAPEKSSSPRAAC
jgi:hypothetical protein